MNWDDDHGEESGAEEDYLGDAEESTPEDPGDPEGDAADGGDDELPSAGEAISALDHLAHFHETNRDEFLRMAAVQELGPQLREALQILLTLAPEAVATLAEIMRLPGEEQRLIRRAVELPDEVAAALRGLLAE